LNCKYRKKYERLTPSEEPIHPIPPQGLFDDNRRRNVPRGPNNIPRILLVPQSHGIRGPVPGRNFRSYLPSTAADPPYMAVAHSARVCAIHDHHWVSLHLIFDNNPNDQKKFHPGADLQGIRGQPTKNVDCTADNFYHIRSVVHKLLPLYL
jgi:hypothetical protein